MELSSELGTDFSDAVSLLDFKRLENARQVNFRQSKRNGKRC